MREIKFRAWSLIHNEMRMNPSLSCKDGKWSLRQKGPSTLEQEDMILEQYTGIKDNGGAEIYEGDVLRFSNCPGLGDGIAYVVFKDSEGCFYVQNDELDIWNPIYDVTDFCLIIGNIHENKELLANG